MINELINNLKSLGYDTHFFENRTEALDYLNNAIDNTTVGIGGSVTVKELGLFDILNKHNKVYWHMLETDRTKSREIINKAKDAKVYISSVNAISANGEIVNIDGTSNRVASISYGHEDVYFIVGKNKIASSLHEAINRAQNVAAPLNAIRLNRKTPCIKDKKCHNCKSPERICRNMQILSTAPTGMKYHVILIDENLGY
ncbi:MAG: lactate utilization protein [Erysipelotrichaceae bacterium]|nr:lactate utilization protein [Erysipelotrichaceae bacterium]